MISLGWISALPVIVPVALLIASPFLVRLAKSRKQLARQLLRALVVSFIGMFLGLMVATAGGAVYPPLWKVGVPWVCDGTANFESHGYSYKPGQSGVTRNVDCVNPADGSREDITGSLVVTSTLIYGGALSLLLLLLSLPWLRSRRGIGEMLGAGGTSGRADIDAKVEQFRRRLHTGRGSTVVTINGQSVDNDTNADVAQLVQRIVSSNLQERTADNDDHDIRHIFGKLAEGQLAASNHTETLDESLRQLKRLNDQHLITDTEYASKKTDLLSRL